MVLSVGLYENVVEVEAGEALRNRLVADEAKFDPDLFPVGGSGQEDGIRGIPHGVVPLNGTHELLDQSIIVVRVKHPD